MAVRPYREEIDNPQEIGATATRALPLISLPPQAVHRARAALESADSAAIPTVEMLCSSRPPRATCNRPTHPGRWVLLYEGPLSTVASRSRRQSGTSRASHSRFVGMRSGPGATRDCHLVRYARYLP